jgi:ornithine carbamoyltransferase|tara:strand:+ start:390 stop:683 length:294 start_codon:yes stop_codon:yes gene_type:complete
MSYNITENDYGFVENPESDLYGIKLKSGKWKNVIVVYGKVTIKESPETGIATLGFTYQVQDPSSWQIDELESNEDFKNYLGDLLTHIIESKEETYEE